jgi:release factor glutamine methyltransferase
MSSDRTPTTVEQLLRNPTYKEKNILEKLLIYKLKVTREDLISHIERPITTQDQDWIDRAYQDYTQAHQPIEYIVWHCTFGWYQFKVTPATLIPRPETEYMIEAVRERLTTTRQAPILIDLGTWCGVLGLSTLLHAPQPLTEIFLTDVANDALAVAQQNATTYHDLITQRHPDLSMHRLHADLLDHPFLIQTLTNHTNPKHLLIVANLPYIPDAVFEEQVEPRVKKREPKMAFVWGDDWLDLYRRTLDQLIQASPAATVTLFLEMMTRQVDLLRAAYHSCTRSEVKTFHMNIRIVKCEMRKVD